MTLFRNILKNAKYPQDIKELSILRLSQNVIKGEALLTAVLTITPHKQPLEFPQPFPGKEIQKNETWL